MKTPLVDRLEIAIMAKQNALYDSNPGIIKIHADDARQAQERWGMKYTSQGGKVYQLKVLGTKIDLSSR